MKWFRKKTAHTLLKKAPPAANPFNLVPKPPQNTEKFTNDGQNCVEKEYAALKGKNVTDLNIDIHTGSHKGDSRYEIAHLNKELLETLNSAKCLFGKQFGEAVLLYEKIERFEQEVHIKEKELEAAKKALKEWEDTYV